MKILLLAGTAEARRLGPDLAEAGHQVTASLAGATSQPAPQGASTRSGGFGGVAGLIQWLREAGAEAIIDATHPFADTMPWHAARAAEALSLPRLRLMRPAWPVEPGWLTGPDIASALSGVPPSARVLATTGRGETGALEARADLRIWLRSIDPGPRLPGHITPITARPPFSVAEETRLMRDLGITHLLSKNAGGDAAKLAAAKGLGVHVAMVSRPHQPEGPMAATPEGALAWIAGISPTGNPARDR